MNNLNQIVKDFTRETHLSQTIIDLVFTNNNEIKCSVISSMNIADHNMLKISVKNNENIDPKLNINKSSKYCWKNYSKSALNNEIEQFDWNSCNNINNVEEKFKFLFSNLESSVKKFVTIKDMNCNNDKKFNNYINNLRKEVSKMKFFYKNDKSEHNWHSYKIKRNQYKNEVRAINNKEIQNEIEKNINDSKKLWKILKSFYSSRSDKICCVKFDNHVEFDEKKIANDLNEFFVNSVVKICAEIPTNNIDMNDIENIEENVNKFELKTVEMSKIKQVLKTFVNKNYIDLINGKVLNDAIENEKFGKEISEFINESLNAGYVPDCWKISTVVPLKKVPNTMKAEEMRPINMLPIPEKLVEVIVKDQLLEFIEENKILVESQSGFRKHHSCETALNFVLAGWKEDIEDGKFIVSVFLDFKRAFETINRSKLIRKLKR